jgi:hypothetical protein
MTEKILADLQAQGFVSDAQATAITRHEREKPFSLYYELRTLLSLGITLLSTGLGLLIYLNIDRLSHLVIVAGIAGLCAACFGYAYWRRPPFSWQEAVKTSTLADFALLLGCLTFLTLEGYLQAQYNLFGSRYGLLPLLPAALFFYCAYRFDHRGVLAMAITALAAWVGVAIAPASAFRENDFAVPGLDTTAIVLGLVLTGVGIFTDFRHLKRHFSYTYVLLGSNLALVAACSTLFHSYYDTGHLPAWVGVLLLLGFSGGLYWYAPRAKSYVFVLMAAVYGYIAVTYCFFQLADGINSEASALLFMLYFLLSATGVVLLLKNIKHIVHSHESESL